MKEQNLQNHARYVPLFHFIFSTIVVILLVMSIVNLVSAFSHGMGLLPAFMFFLIALSFLIVFVFMRVFPLAAQNRAIRAEENLRYFTLTGKLFDSRLKLSQIIALRFAADAELVELTARAIKENLSNRDIKTAIHQWKADHHRV